MANQSVAGLNNPCWSTTLTLIGARNGLRPSPLSIRHSSASTPASASAFASASVSVFQCDPLSLGGSADRSGNADGTNDGNSRNTFLDNRYWQGIRCQCDGSVWCEPCGEAARGIVIPLLATYVARINGETDGDAETFVGYCFAIFVVGRLLASLAMGVLI